MSSNVRVVPFVPPKVRKKKRAEDTLDSEWKAVPPLSLGLDQPLKAAYTSHENLRAYRLFSIMDSDRKGCITKRKLFKLLFGDYLLTFKTFFDHADTGIVWGTDEANYVCIESLDKESPASLRPELINGLRLYRLNGLEIKPEGTSALIQVEQILKDFQAKFDDDLDDDKSLSKFQLIFELYDPVVVIDPLSCILDVEVNAIPYSVALPTAAYYDLRVLADVIRDTFVQINSPIHFIDIAVDTKMKKVTFSCEDFPFRLLFSRGPNYQRSCRAALGFVPEDYPYAYTHSGQPMAIDLSLKVNKQECNVIIREVFEKFDEDKSGDWSFEEFRDFYIKLLDTEAARELLKKYATQRLIIINRAVWWREIMIRERQKAVNRIRRRAFNRAIVTVQQQYIKDNAVVDPDFITRKEFTHRRPDYQRVIYRKRINDFEVYDAEANAAIDTINALEEEGQGEKKNGDAAVRAIEDGAALPAILDTTTPAAATANANDITNAVVPAPPAAAASVSFTATNPLMMRPGSPAIARQPKSPGPSLAALAPLKMPLLSNTTSTSNLHKRTRKMMFHRASIDLRSENHHSAAAAMVATAAATATGPSSSPFSASPPQMTFTKSETRIRIDERKHQAAAQILARAALSPDNSIALHSWIDSPVRGKFSNKRRLREKQRTQIEQRKRILAQLKETADEVRTKEQQSKIHLMEMQKLRTTQILEVHSDLRKGLASLLTTNESNFEGISIIQTNIEKLSANPALRLTSAIFGKSITDDDCAVEALPSSAMHPAASRYYLLKKPKSDVSSNTTATISSILYNEKLVDMEEEDYTSKNKHSNKNNNKKKESVEVNNDDEISAQRFANRPGKYQAGYDPTMQHPAFFRSDYTREPSRATSVSLGAVRLIVREREQGLQYRAAHGIRYLANRKVPKEDILPPKKPIKNIRELGRQQSIFPMKVDDEITRREKRVLQSGREQLLPLMEDGEGNTDDNDDVAAGVRGGDNDDDKQQEQQQRYNDHDDNDDVLEGHAEDSDNDDRETRSKRSRRTVTFGDDLHHHTTAPEASNNAADYGGYDDGDAHVVGSDSDVHTQSLSLLLPAAAAGQLPPLPTAGVLGSSTDLPEAHAADHDAAALTEETAAAADGPVAQVDSSKVVARMRVLTVKLWGLSSVHLLKKNSPFVTMACGSQVFTSEVKSNAGDSVVWTDLNWCFDLEADEELSLNVSSTMFASMDIKNGLKAPTTTTAATAAADLAVVQMEEDHTEKKVEQLDKDRSQYTKSPSSAKPRPISIVDPSQPASHQHFNPLAIGQYVVSVKGFIEGLPLVAMTRRAAAGDDLMQLEGPLMKVSSVVDRVKHSLLPMLQAAATLAKDRMKNKDNKEAEADDEHANNQLLQQQVAPSRENHGKKTHRFRLLRSLIDDSIRRKYMKNLASASSSSSASLLRNVMTMTTTAAAAAAAAIDTVDTGKLYIVFAIELVRKDADDEPKLDPWFSKEDTVKRRKAARIHRRQVRMDIQQTKSEVIAEEVVRITNNLSVSVSATPGAAAAGAAGGAAVGGGDAHLHRQLSIKLAASGQMTSNSKNKRSASAAAGGAGSDNQLQSSQSAPTIPTMIANGGGGRDGHDCSDNNNRDSSRDPATATATSLVPGPLVNPSSIVSREGSFKTKKTVTIGGEEAAQSSSPRGEPSSASSKQSKSASSSAMSQLAYLRNLSSPLQTARSLLSQLSVAEEEKDKEKSWSLAMVITSATVDDVPQLMIPTLGRQEVKIIAVTETGWEGEAKATVNAGFTVTWNNPFTSSFTIQHIAIVPDDPSNSSNASPSGGLSPITVASGFANNYSAAAAVSPFSGAISSQRSNLTDEPPSQTQSLKMISNNVAAGEEEEVDGIELKGVYVEVWAGMEVFGSIMIAPKTVKTLYDNSEDGHIAFSGALMDGAIKKGRFGFIASITKFTDQPPAGPSEQELDGGESSLISLPPPAADGDDEDVQDGSNTGVNLIRDDQKKLDNNVDAFSSSREDNEDVKEEVAPITTATAATSVGVTEMQQQRPGGTRSPEAVVPSTEEGGANVTTAAAAVLVPVTGQQVVDPPATIDITAPPPFATSSTAHHTVPLSASVSAAVAVPTVVPALREPHHLPTAVTATITTATAIATATATVTRASTAPATPSPPTRRQSTSTAGSPFAPRSRAGSGGILAVAANTLTNAMTNVVAAATAGAGGVVGAHHPMVSSPLVTANRLFPAPFRNLSSRSFLLGYRDSESATDIHTSASGSSRDDNEENAPPRLRDPLLRERTATDVNSSLASFSETATEASSGPTTARIATTRSEAATAPISVSSSATVSRDPSSRTISREVSSRGISRDPDPSSRGMILSRIIDDPLREGDGLISPSVGSSSTIIPTSSTSNNNNSIPQQQQYQHQEITVHSLERALDSLVVAERNEGNNEPPSPSSVDVLALSSAGEQSRGGIVTAGAAASGTAGAAAAAASAATGAAADATNTANIAAAATEESAAASSSRQHRLLFVETKNAMKPLSSLQDSSSPFSSPGNNRFDRSDSGYSAAFSQYSRRSSAGAASASSVRTAGSRSTVASRSLSVTTATPQNLTIDCIDISVSDLVLPERLLAAHTGAGARGNNGKSGASLHVRVDCNKWQSKTKAAPNCIDSASWEDVHWNLKMPLMTFARFSVCHESTVIGSVVVSTREIVETPKDRMGTSVLKRFFEDDEADRVGSLRITMNVQISNNGNSSIVSNKRKNLAAAGGFIGAGSHRGSMVGSPTGLSSPGGSLTHGSSMSMMDLEVPSSLTLPSAFPAQPRSPGGGFSAMASIADDSFIDGDDDDDDGVVGASQQMVLAVALSPTAATTSIASNRDAARDSTGKAGGVSFRGIPGADDTSAGGFDDGDVGGSHMQPQSQQQPAYDVAMIKFDLITAVDLDVTIGSMLRVEACVGQWGDFSKEAKVVSGMVSWGNFNWPPLVIEQGTVITVKVHKGEDDCLGSFAISGRKVFNAPKGADDCILVSGKLIDLERAYGKISVLLNVTYPDVAAMVQPTRENGSVAPWGFLNDVVSGSSPLQSPSSSTIATRRRNIRDSKGSVSPTATAATAALAPWTPIDDAAAAVAPRPKRSGSERKPLISIVPDVINDGDLSPRGRMMTSPSRVNEPDRLAYLAEMEKDRLRKAHEEKAKRKEHMISRLGNSARLVMDVEEGEDDSIKSSASTSRLNNNMNKKRSFKTKYITDKEKKFYRDFRGDSWDKSLSDDESELSSDVSSFRYITSIPDDAMSGLGSHSPHTNNRKSKLALLLRPKTSRGADAEEQMGLTAYAEPSAQISQMVISEEGVSAGQHGYGQTSVSAHDDGAPGTMAGQPQFEEEEDRIVRQDELGDYDYTNNTYPYPPAHYGAYAAAATAHQQGGESPEDPTATAVAAGSGGDYDGYGYEAAPAYDDFSSYDFFQSYLQEEATYFAEFSDIVEEILFDISALDWPILDGVSFLPRIVGVATAPATGPPALGQRTVDYHEHQQLVQQQVLAPSSDISIVPSESESKKPKTISLETRKIQIVAKEYVNGVIDRTVSAFVALAGEGDYLYSGYDDDGSMNYLQHMNEGVSDMEGMDVVGGYKNYADSNGSNYVKPAGRYTGIEEAGGQRQHLHYPNYHHDRHPHYPIEPMMPADGSPDHALLNIPADGDLEVVFRDNHAVVNYMALIAVQQAVQIGATRAVFHLIHDDVPRDYFLPDDDHHQHQQQQHQQQGLIGANGGDASSSPPSPLSPTAIDYEDTDSEEDGCEGERRKQDHWMATAAAISGSGSEFLLPKVFAEAEVEGTALPPHLAAAMERLRKQFANDVNSSVSGSKFKETEAISVVATAAAVQASTDIKGGSIVAAAEETGSDGRSGVGFQYSYKRRKGIFLANQDTTAAVHENENALGGLGVHKISPTNLSTHTSAAVAAAQSEGLALTGDQGSVKATSTRARKTIADTRRRALLKAIRGELNDKGDAAGDLVIEAAMGGSSNGEGKDNRSGAVGRAEDELQGLVNAGDITQEELKKVQQRMQRKRRRRAGQIMNPKYVRDHLETGYEGSGEGGGGGGGGFAIDALLAHELAASLSLADDNHRHNNAAAAHNHPRSMMKVPRRAVFTFLDLLDVDFTSFFVHPELASADSLKSELRSKPPDATAAAPTFPKQPYLTARRALGNWACTTVPFFWDGGSGGGVDGGVEGGVDGGVKEGEGERAEEDMFLSWMELSDKQHGSGWDPLVLKVGQCVIMEIHDADTGMIVALAKLDFSFLIVHPRGTDNRINVVVRFYITNHYGGGTALGTLIVHVDTKPPPPPVPYRPASYWEQHRLQHWKRYPLTPIAVGQVRHMYGEIAQEYDRQMIIHPAFFGFNVRWKGHPDEESRFVHPMFRGYNLAKQPLSKKEADEVLRQNSALGSFTNPFKWDPSAARLGKCPVCQDGLPGCPYCYVLPLRPNGGGERYTPKDFAYEPVKYAEEKAAEEKKREEEERKRKEKDKRRLRIILSNNKRLLAAEEGKEEEEEERSLTQSQIQAAFESSVLSLPSASPVTNTLPILRMVGATSRTPQKKSRAITAPQSTGTMSESSHHDVYGDEEEQLAKRINIKIHTVLTTYLALSEFRRIQQSHMHVYVKCLPGGHVVKLTVDRSDTVFHLYNMFNSHTRFGNSKGSMILLPTDNAMYEMDNTQERENEHTVANLSAFLPLSRYGFRRKGSVTVLLHFQNYQRPQATTLLSDYLSRNSDFDSQKKLPIYYKLVHLPDDIHKGTTQDLLRLLTVRQFLDQQKIVKDKYIRMAQEYKNQYKRLQVESGINRHAKNVSAANMSTNVADKDNDELASFVQVLVKTLPEEQRTEVLRAIYLRNTQGKLAAHELLTLLPGYSVDLDISNKGMGAAAAADSSLTGGRASSSSNKGPKSVAEVVSTALKKYEKYVERLHHRQQATTRRRSQTEGGVEG